MDYTVREEAPRPPACRATAFPPQTWPAPTAPWAGALLTVHGLHGQGGGALSSGLPCDGVSSPNLARADGALGRRLVNCSWTTRSGRRRLVLRPAVRRRFLPKPGPRRRRPGP